VRAQKQRIAWWIVDDSPSDQRYSRKVIYSKGMRNRKGAFKERISAHYVLHCLLCGEHEDALAERLGIEVEAVHAVMSWHLMEMTDKEHGPSRAMLHTHFERFARGGARIDRALKLIDIFADAQKAGRVITITDEQKKR
jgi:hypothetical protein